MALIKMSGLVQIFVRICGYMARLSGVRAAKKFTKTGIANNANDGNNKFEFKYAFMLIKSNTIAKIYAIIYNGTIPKSTKPNSRVKIICRI
jgi:hypothetical protein